MKYTGNHVRRAAMLTIIRTSRRLNAYAMIPARSIDLPRKGRAPLDGRTLPRRLRRHFEPKRGTGSPRSQDCSDAVMRTGGRFGSGAGLILCGTVGTPTIIRCRRGLSARAVRLLAAF